MSGDKLPMVIDYKGMVVPRTLWKQILLQSFTPLNNVQSLIGRAFILGVGKSGIVAHEPRLRIVYVHVKRTHLFGDYVLTVYSDDDYEFVADEFEQAIAAKYNLSRIIEGGRLFLPFDQLDNNSLMINIAGLVASLVEKGYASPEITDEQLAEKLTIVGSAVLLGRFDGFVVVARNKGGVVQGETIQGVDTSQNYTYKAQGTVIFGDYNPVRDEIVLQEPAIVVEIEKDTGDYIVPGKEYPLLPPPAGF